MSVCPSVECPLLLATLFGARFLSVVLPLAPLFVLDFSTPFWTAINVKLAAFFLLCPLLFSFLYYFFFFFYHCCLYWPRFVVCGQFWFAACCHCCFGSPSWLLNSIDDVLTDCLMSFHFLCCRLRSAAQLLTGAAAMNYSCNNHTGAHFVAALLNFFPSLGSMSAALGLHQAIRSDAIRSDPNGRPWSWVSAGSLLSLNVSIDIADYTGQQG